ncbi:S49 family peptidase [Chryseobacterium sp. PTM-20240506]|uniref:S49 family peptidase n=1 Tax=Chryseobacterium sp. PTM-20240506 TaxID=3400631 RepID=UPI003AAB380A
MHGQNIFLNQPLAIDKNYLLSTITNIISGYQQKNFSSAESIVQQAQSKIEMQASSAMSSGADVFPVVLDINGPIIKYSSWYYLGTQDIIAILRRLDRNQSVSGIVLNIDSGGGMVSGTAELTHTIKNLSKPTIAYTGGYMCSAAMDIASGANFRMANPFADLIGSIGTMLSYQDFSKMFEKWGATMYEIYAPQSTEKNKEFRDLQAGDSKAYEERLKEMTADFISRMQENMKETLKDDGLVMKGKTYTPKQALSVGLINEIGTLEDALVKF